MEAPNDEGKEDHIKPLYNNVEISVGSAENSTNNRTEQVDVPKINSPVKMNLFARKRLQVYQGVSKAKLESSKEKKTLKEPVLKPSSSSGETAKAIVRDIELLKRAGYGYGPRNASAALPTDIIIPDDPVICLPELPPLPSGPLVVSLASDFESRKMFKKREIKCRNIRKGDSAPRKSQSPRKDEVKTEKDYPRSWAEYKKLGLNYKKHMLLKSKLVRKSLKQTKLDYKKYLDFQTPVPIDMLKCESESGNSIWVPFQYLRCTATKPQVLYSTNHNMTSPGYLTREQVFSLIPKERKTIIQRLMKPSKCESDSKSYSARKWYPKIWKTNHFSEAKLLETSVGLSFLQSYSGEEDEEEFYEESSKKHENIAENEDFTPKSVNLENTSHRSTLQTNAEYYKTPPIGDKEEGEVSEEEIEAQAKNDIDGMPDDFDLTVAEYEKTKEELKQLEAALTSKSETLETFSEHKENTPNHDDKRKRDKKKKRRARHEKIVKSKKADKKKSKKKVHKKKEKPSESSVSPAEEINSRKKSKKKKEKDDKSKKNKRNKYKYKKKKSPVESDSEFDIDLVLDRPSKSKKKKLKLSEKRPKKAINKSADTISLEGYEDDFMFFADRFDAERKLKGRSKHKTKTNITLDDLTLQLKTDEIISKQKTNESKCISEENVVKKDVIKVDLLKMNEDYLREQKRKEEEAAAKNGESREKRSLSKEKTKTRKDSVIDEVELNITENKSNDVESDRTSHKRKRSEKCDNAIEQCDDPISEQPDLIALKDIKKERGDCEAKLPEVPLPTTKSNSWESDEEPTNLEAPLNVEFPDNKDIKMEQKIIPVQELCAAPLIEQTDSPVPDVIEINDLNCALPTVAKKRRWDIKTIKPEIIDVEETLENEYEEFLKAVTVADKKTSIIVDSSSESSIVFMEESKKQPPVVETCTEETTSTKLPTIQIPVIPEQIQPVPVPSPNFLDLNKPLINLSLSANVTQNITLSLATSIPSVSAPSVQISTPKDNLGLNVESQTAVATSTPKVSFTSLSLPSKNVLIDNSKLNLNDSDDEEDKLKHVKLQAIIEENKKDTLDEGSLKKEQPTKADLSKSTSSKHVSKSPKRTRRESSPKRRRDSLKDSSPKRRSSPSSRRKSPRRSPSRRHSSPRRDRSPRRRNSTSPKRRRISTSRSRRSPSPKRKRQLSPAKDSNNRKSRSRRSKSPSIQRKSSPLKRSLADSTISDDQLRQMNEVFDAVLHRQPRNEITHGSPKRVPLDVRINQVLGFNEPPPQPESVLCQDMDYHHNRQLAEQCNVRPQPASHISRMPQSTYRQVGNMLHIVPTESLTDVPCGETSVTSGYELNSEVLPSEQQPFVEMRSKILQVGNMLQIVPTEIPPTELIPVPPSPPPTHQIKLEKTEEVWPELNNTQNYNDSLIPPAEAAIIFRVNEMQAERERRRQERERRRKEKETRRKEKEKIRQAKMKIKTENMIKRALELEEEENDGKVDELNENQGQWPPLSIVVSHSQLFKGKSILVNRYNKQMDECGTEEKKMKLVQFADGVRPGDGTSPSAGEELYSPPPPNKKLPKEKRYTKLKFNKKSGKRKKVKVKIIRKLPSPLDDSDSDDNLPPPSPPPGSPPPHIFPPRIKLNPVNNVPANYLATIIHTAQQQQQQQLNQSQQTLPPFQPNIYRPPINMMLVPPHHPPPHQTFMNDNHLPSPRGVAIAPPPPPPPSHSSNGHSRLY